MSEGIKSAVAQPTGAPWWVTIFTPVTRSLWAPAFRWVFNGSSPFAAGTGGLPRTTPIRDHPVLRQALGLVSVGGGQLGCAIFAPPGEAQITFRGRRKRYGRPELDPTQRVAFFRDTLGPVARTIPFGRAFIRIVDGTDLDKPEEAAEGRPVFELDVLR
jgi:hypothetical protein